VYGTRDITRRHTRHRSGAAVAFAASGAQLMYAALSHLPCTNGSRRKAPHRSSMAHPNLDEPETHGSSSHRDLTILMAGGGMVVHFSWCGNDLVWHTDCASIAYGPPRLDDLDGGWWDGRALLELGGPAELDRCGHHHQHGPVLLEVRADTNRLPRLAQAHLRAKGGRMVTD
jgi:hypothetical protein